MTYQAPVARDSLQGSRGSPLKAVATLQVASSIYIHSPGVLSLQECSGLMTLQEAVSIDQERESSAGWLYLYWDDQEWQAPRPEPYKTSLAKIA